MEAIKNVRGCISNFSLRRTERAAKLAASGWGAGLIMNFSTSKSIGSVRQNGSCEKSDWCQTRVGFDAVR